MPFRTLARRKINQLTLGIDSLCAGSFFHVQRRCVGTPQEPDWVAGLLLHGTSRFARHLSKVLAPHPVSVTGIFCHQSPMVEHPHGRCELGDVMWVHQHTNLDGEVERRAILLQAKMSHALPHQIAKQELVQYQLYNSWPDFKYYRGPLNDTTRKVNPSQPHLGAQYLLIDDPVFPLRRPYVTGRTIARAITCDAVDPLVMQASLGRALAGMLAGQSGRSFVDEATARAGKDWDAVVWDLLSMTTTKIFNRRNARYVGEPRQVSLLTSLDGLAVTFGAPSRLVTSLRGEEVALSLVDDGENAADIPPGEWLPEAPRNEGGGVSTIIIETWDHVENQF